METSTEHSKIYEDTSNQDLPLVPAKGGDLGGDQIQQLLIEYILSAAGKYYVCGSDYC